MKYIWSEDPSPGIPTGRGEKAVCSPFPSGKGVRGLGLPAAALLCAVAGAALRLLHAFQFRAAPEADEAVVGLMARHILAGQAWPAFYYGQAYLGALEAYLVAALGASPLSLKLVPALFSVALIGLAYAWTRDAFGREAACIAAILVAFPPAYVFDFTLRARGGFVEAIALLLLALLLARRVARGAPPRAVGLLGLVCGLTVWTYQTFAVHLLVLGAVQWRTQGLPGGRRTFWWASGFLLGIAPMLTYNVLHPLATLWELGVKYAGVTGGMYKTHGAFGAVLQGVLRRAADVAAFPKQVALLYTAESDPAVEAADLSPLSLAVLSIHAVAVAAAVWMRGCEGDRPSGRTVTLWMLAATVITGFFRARYLMPCVVFLAALAGRGLADRRVRPPLLAAVLAVLVFYNARQIWTDFRTDEQAPCRDLIAALRENGLRYGYTGYEIAYPVVFLSEETLILSPKAGPVSFDRLPHYTDRVLTETQVCYIFEDGSGTDLRFRALLTGLGAPCERLRAGRFAIYHGLPPDAVRAIPLPVGTVAER